MGKEEAATLPSAAPLPNASKEIQEIKEGVGDITIRMNAVKITNQDEYDGAALVLKEANLAIKKLEVKRDELLRQPRVVEVLTYVERLKDSVKAVITTIKTSMDNVKQQGNQFIREEEAKRQREIAKQAAAREKASQAAVAADTRKDQAKQVAKAAVAEASIETLQAQNPGHSGRRRVFRVVDEKMVPRAYLMVNERAIRESMGKVGTPFPTIPGVEFEDAKEMRG